MNFISLCSQFNNWYSIVSVTCRCEEDSSVFGKCRAVQQLINYSFHLLQTFLTHANYNRLRSFSSSPVFEYERVGYVCVFMNNKSCFPASCGDLSLVLNSHFPELSHPCGAVIERLLVWEREIEKAIGRWHRQVTCSGKTRGSHRLKKYKSREMCYHVYLKGEITINCDFFQ